MDLTTFEKAEKIVHQMKRLENIKTLANSGKEPEELVLLFKRTDNSGVLDKITSKDPDILKKTLKLYSTSVDQQIAKLTKELKDLK